MRYSTTVIDPKTALNLVKKNKVEVYSASDLSLFITWPLLGDIITANKSDPNHIIFNLKGARFVDYKLI